MTLLKPRSAVMPVRRKTAVPKKQKAARNKKKQPHLSPTHPPEDLSLEEWQLGLRRESAHEQTFAVENLTDQAVFSDFLVSNPQTRRSYTVTIRGHEVGMNRCTCPDFQINTLGTCKHIEFTLKRLRSKRDGKRLLRAGYQPTNHEVWLRYGGQRDVVLSLGAAPSAGMQALVREFFHHGVLRSERYHDFDSFVKRAAALGERVHCVDSALDFLACVHDVEQRHRILDRKYGSGPLDGLLQTQLYPYQAEGALFAARAGRALLADDMGLGKTVQALAYVELMVREFNVERVLIICPASLKYQWLQEIEKFTQRSATVVEGLTHQRREGYGRDTLYKIVNYDVVHRDLETIAQNHFDVVILDEAQRIKNWKTRAAQAVKSIDTPYALVLTGTPLENRLEELHSIVEFVDRFRLGPAFRFLSNHQQVDPQSGRVNGYRDLKRIGETLKPILLRRRQAEVLKQLPARVEKNFFVPMTREQREIHTENAEIVTRIVHKWRKYKFLSESDQLRLQIALQRMRMACDNSWLVDQKTQHGPKLAELLTLLTEMFEEPGTKVIVFSQWQRMLDLVKPELERLGIGHTYLHGGVPSKERRHLVSRFNQDAETRVFLSTDAGGVGLNLQAASCVINLDLPWNPAVLNQRIGRAHRIGQQRTVRVVNLVSEGTIEHGMLGVLKFKKDLFSGVLDGGDDMVAMEGGRLNKFMKSIEMVTEAVPQTAQEAPVETEVEPQPAAAEPQSWEPVLRAAASLLNEIGGAMVREPKLRPTVAVDTESGQPYLRLPLPEPKVLQSLAAALGPLVDVFKQWSASA